MIETFRKLETEKNDLNTIKDIYQEPTASIILSVEWFKTFPLTSRQGYLHYLYKKKLLEFLARTQR